MQCLTSCQLKLDIYQLKEICPFDLAANKGQSNLSAEEVSSAYLFDVSTDADISIIVGPPIKGHCHLVLACFHNPKMLLKEQTSINEMFCDLLAVAGKNGFECQRKGGSNGVTCHNRAFMKFLATPGPFPRPARSIIILQGKAKWECLYMLANNRDDVAAVEAWNKDHPTCKLQIARKIKWNLKHPECPK